jgi:hypothetical protein
VEIKAGTRLRSAVCDAEVIVVKAPGGEVDLRAGGAPMLPIDAERPGGDGGPAAGFDKGVLLGKRYTDDAGTLEILCTKPGPSSLSVGEEPLGVKEAKPLPSSD